MVGSKLTEVSDDVIVVALSPLETTCHYEEVHYIGLFTTAEIKYSLAVWGNDIIV
jgi:hypothetical protein